MTTYSRLALNRNPLLHERLVCVADNKHVRHCFIRRSSSSSSRTGDNTTSRWVASHLAMSKEIRQRTSSGTARASERPPGLHTRGHTRRRRRRRNYISPVRSPRLLHLRQTTVYAWSAASTSPSLHAVSSWVGTDRLKPINGTAAAALDDVTLSGHRTTSSFRDQRPTRGPQKKRGTIFLSNCATAHSNILHHGTVWAPRSCSCVRRGLNTIRFISDKPCTVRFSCVRSFVRGQVRSTQPAYAVRRPVNETGTLANWIFASVGQYVGDWNIYLLPSVKMFAAGPTSCRSPTTQ